MHADAVIFDKDGTLMDFDVFWVGVSRTALGDILRQLGREDIPIDEIMEAYGVHDGVTDLDGVLCKGTYFQMGELLWQILTRHGCAVALEETVRLVNEAFHHSTDAGEVRPTCPGLRKLLQELKAQGKYIALVTTDIPSIARACLQQLGIEEFFDRIYTDDGHTPNKPDPSSALDFCNWTGVPRERTVMVGDTMTDMRFARNAGIGAIAVAKSQEAAQRLAPHADAVIPALSCLRELLQ